MKAQSIDLATAQRIISMLVGELASMKRKQEDLCKAYNIQSTEMMMLMDAMEPIQNSYHMLKQAGEVVAMDYIELLRKHALTLEALEAYQESAEMFEEELLSK